MVPKRDGTNCLCIEFRKLNANTVKDSFPIMRINEVLSSFYWANWFSSVDKLKTDVGKYRWFKDEKKRQLSLHWMDCINLKYCYLEFVMLHDLSRGSCTRYFESIFQDFAPFIWMMLASTCEDHMNYLQIITNALKVSKLKVELSKCKSGKTFVNFLGHIVSTMGIHSTQSNITAVTTFQICCKYGKNIWEKL